METNKKQQKLKIAMTAMTDPRLIVFKRWRLFWLLPDRTNAERVMRAAGLRQNSTDLMATVSNQEDPRRFHSSAYADPRR